MPTYQVTPKKDNYCRHFAEVINPTLPDDLMTPPTTPQETQAERPAVYIARGAHPIPTEEVSHVSPFVQSTGTYMSPSGPGKGSGPRRRDASLARPTCLAKG